MNYCRKRWKIKDDIKLNDEELYEEMNKYGYFNSDSSSIFMTHESQDSEISFSYLKLNKSTRIMAFMNKDFEKGFKAIRKMLKAGLIEETISETEELEEEYGKFYCECGEKYDLHEMGIAYTFKIGLFGYCDKCNESGKLIKEIGEIGS